MKVKVLGEYGKNGVHGAPVAAPGSVETLEADEKALRKWHSETAIAALAFESRWTVLALRRVDPGLAEALVDQRNLFAQACITGSADQIVLQGAATCRGYAAAVRALEAAAEPDDAYQLGRCPRTGTVVAIGEQKAAVERVRELHGESVVWITPDEVATLFASAESFKSIAAIKNLWPGAEVIDRHAHEST